MTDDVSEYEILISGYLDGELDDAQRRRVEDLLESRPSFRREFEAMRRLVTGTEAACSITEPPPETWDTFFDDVYNQLERRVGWYLVLLGLVALFVYGAFLYISEPWAGPFAKVLIAIPIFGVALLFISVLRQRLNIMRRDRYTREIHR